MAYMVKEHVKSELFQVDGFQSQAQSEALSAALAAGSRRRALTQLATPPPALGGKRPLKKSPDTSASTASPATVTPDPKRFMVSSNEKMESGSATSGCEDKPTASVPAVSPMELFPQTNVDVTMDTPGLVVHSHDVFPASNIVELVCMNHLVLHNPC